MVPSILAVQQDPCSLEDKKSDRSVWYNEHWADIYLQNARKRLAKEIEGFDLIIEVVYTIQ